jgi:hypothetical protein
MEAHACVVGQRNPSEGAAETAFAKLVQELCVQGTSYPLSEVVLANVGGGLNGASVSFPSAVGRSVRVPDQLTTSHSDEP